MQQHIQISSTSTITVTVDPQSSDMLFDDGMLTGEAFDDTGVCRVWPASIALCRWLEQHASTIIRGRRIIEIGAGTGLPSLLCAQSLGASRVLATDANATAVSKLSAALTPPHAASLLSWDASDALANIAAAESIDTVLMADVVYPSKDPTPLLDALRHLLSSHNTGVEIIIALTCRDPAIHKSFEAALHGLPKASVELSTVDEGEEDPLYGKAAVHIYRVHAAASAPAASSTWRIAAAKLQLWPSEPPAVQTYHHGWVHKGNETMLKRLIAERKPRVIVELGSWLGLCTALLLEESGNAAVFAIDRWDATFLLDQQRDQYARDDEALGMLNGIPLYETFLVNTWEWRQRLFPMRMDTVDGLRAVAALGAPVDLIYIDADHTEAGVTRDIRAAEECFPDALICGDDWSWPGVRQAVEKYAADSGGRLAVEAHQNWWVLSTTR